MLRSSTFGWIAILPIFTACAGGEIPVIANDPPETTTTVTPTTAPEPGTGGTVSATGG